MIEEWTNELVPSMLPDGLSREIAMEIGMDNFLKLSQLVGGATVYIPQKESILRSLRNQKIQEEYDGYNVMALSKKYRVSKRWVYKIIEQGFKNHTSEKK